MFPHPAAIQQPAATAIKPLHDIAISVSGGSPNDSLIAPDGLTVYIVEPMASINLWDVGSYFWPEWLLLVALMALSWRLLSVFRRRPQSRQGRNGALTLYCRRCNYDLSDTALVVSPTAQPLRCPECGIDTARKPPVRGRSPKARLRLSFVFASVAALRAVTAWTIQPGIRTLFSGLFEWQSAAAADWLANSHPGVPLPGNAFRNGTAVRQIDVATGKTTHTYYLPGSPSMHQLTMAPGGNFLAFQGIDGSPGVTICLLDLNRHTQKTVANLQSTVRPAGLSDDGKRFYYTDRYAATVLMCMDTASGTTVQFSKWPVFDRAFSNHWACVIDQHGEVTQCYIGQLQGAMGVPDWETAFHLSGPNLGIDGTFGGQNPFEDYKFDLERRLMFMGRSRHTGPALRSMDLRSAKLRASEQTAGPYGPEFDTGSPVIFNAGPPQSQGQAPTLFDSSFDARSTTPSAAVAVQVSVVDRKSGAPIATLAIKPGETLIRGHLSSDGCFVILELTTNAQMMNTSVTTAIRIWRLPTPFKPSP